MVQKEEKPVTWRINYNVTGKRYYVVTNYSGIPAADFYSPNVNPRDGMVVPSDYDSSGDLKI